MMTLPPGFDAGLFFSEYITLALPFIGLGVIFACYILVSKALNSGGRR